MLKQGGQSPVAVMANREESPNTHFPILSESKKIAANSRRSRF